MDSRERYSGGPDAFDRLPEKVRAELVGKWAAEDAATEAYVRRVKRRGAQAALLGGICGGLFSLPSLLGVYYLGVMFLSGAATGYCAARFQLSQMGAAALCGGTAILTTIFYLAALGGVVRGQSMMGGAVVGGFSEGMVLWTWIFQCFLGVVVARFMEAERFGHDVF